MLHNKNLPYATKQLRVPQLPEFGISVPLRGPLSILRDGNDLLRNHGFCNMPVPSETLWQSGRFLLAERSHCYAIFRVRTIAIKMDGDNHAEFMSREECLRICANSHIHLYKLSHIDATPFAAGSYMPTWALNSDIVCGGRSLSSQDDGPVHKRPAAATVSQVELRPFRDQPDYETTQVITTRTTCCLCGTKLHAPASAFEKARVITTNGVVPVFHYKKRCNRRACRKWHAYNFIQVGASNVNFIKKPSDLGKLFFVTGRFGFSKAYIEQFWKRVVRCSLTGVGEAEAFNDYVAEELGIEGVPKVTMKYHIQSAMAYILRLRDIESGVENRLSKDNCREQPWFEQLSERYHFDINDATMSSPLYTGDDLHFLIYSSARDNTELNPDSVDVVVTDGNEYCSRKVMHSEKHMRKAKIEINRGRHKTRVESRRLHLQAHRNTRCRTCVEKTQEVEPGRTGGIYLTMDGTGVAGQSQTIPELREIFSHEDNALREKSFREAGTEHTNLVGWIHDLVCKASFADEVVK